MAGPIVHKEFFKECINNSPINKKNYEENINNCNIYAQGHDLLLYIQLWNFLKNRNISLILSNFYFKEFVYNYLNTSIRNSSIYHDENIKLFLYGYISHHILDSFFHPFIMQYCEDYLPIKNKPWIHGKIETLYDAYFIKEKLKKNVNNYKLYKCFKYHKVKDVNFINNINLSIKDTYNINNIGKKFDLAFNHIYQYMYIYRYDPNNLKKRLGELTDPITKLGASNFFYDENSIYELNNYRNNNNQLWTNIWTKDSDTIITSTDSFDDIYRKALDMTREIISELDKLIKNNDIDKKNVINLIPDRSAITGIECGKKLTFIKYK